MILSVYIVVSSLLLPNTVSIFKTTIIGERNLISDLRKIQLKEFQTVMVTIIRYVYEVPSLTAVPLKQTTKIYS